MAVFCSVLAVIGYAIFLGKSLSLPCLTPFFCLGWNSTDLDLFSYRIIKCTPRLSVLLLPNHWQLLHRSLSRYLDSQQHPAALQESDGYCLGFWIHELWRCVILIQDFSVLVILIFECDSNFRYSFDLDIHRPSSVPEGDQNKSRFLYRSRCHVYHRLAVPRQREQEKESNDRKGRLYRYKGGEVQARGPTPVVHLHTLKTSFP